MKSRLNKKNLFLTRIVSSSGCAAKLAPTLLNKSLCGLRIKGNPNLLVGLEKPDDAGVYKLSDSIAIIQTLDFFPPIVDDPYVFGQIAAVNALSDIYAMGGKPLTAMNIVGFPSDKLPLTVLQQILKGGLKKIHQAGAVLVGGHTINDVELKYGLTVTGIIHPKNVCTNATARIGDKLILTKPIGTGVLVTALKKGMVSQKDIMPAINSMLMLNKKASEIMQQFGVNACTDITGFGLIGHIVLMTDNSNVSVGLSHKSIRYFPNAIKLSRSGCSPAGTRNNLEFYAPFTKIKSNIPKEAVNLLHDPQTSGGLLMAVTKTKAPILLNKLRVAGIKDAHIIGEVIKRWTNKIIVH